MCYEKSACALLKSRCATKKRACVSFKSWRAVKKACPPAPSRDVLQKRRAHLIQALTGYKKDGHAFGTDPPGDDLGESILCGRRFRLLCTRRNCRRED